MLKPTKHVNFYQFFVKCTYFNNTNLYSFHFIPYLYSSQFSFPSIVCFSLLPFSYFFVFQFFIYFSLLSVLSCHLFFLSSLFYNTHSLLSPNLPVKLAISLYFSLSTILLCSSFFLHHPMSLSLLFSFFTLSVFVFSFVL